MATVFAKEKQVSTLVQKTTFFKPTKQILHSVLHIALYFYYSVSSNPPLNAHVACKASGFVLSMF